MANDTEKALASGTDEHIRSVEFPDVSGMATAPAGAANIDMVRDIQVMLTAELGRTNMLIQDILELTPGKVVELDKLAGEPLDILVNGKLLARGEVVMVDERFGVRITSIVDPRTRAAALKAK
jgi:flagellar motor switch protein FliN/FliY